MPKLPHFSLKKSQATVFGQTYEYPSGFNVNWYKKGGIFGGASVIGVGEAGKEAVLPLEGSHMQPFAKALAGQMDMSKQMESYANNQNYAHIVMYNTITNDADGNKFINKVDKWLGNKGFETNYAVGRG